MNTFLKLGAVAAGIAIAVIVGVRLLPGVSQDGASGVSASPSLPPGGFGGSVSIPYLQSTASIETLGALDGSTLTGTVRSRLFHAMRHLRAALDADARPVAREAVR